MVRIHVLSLCVAALTLHACVPRLRVGQASPYHLFVARHVTLLAFWPWLRNVACQSWTSWYAFVQSCEVISISEPSNWRRRAITPSVHPSVASHDLESRLYDSVSSRSFDVSPL